MKYDALCMNCGTIVELGVDGMYDWETVKKLIAQAGWVHGFIEEEGPFDDCPRSYLLCEKCKP